MRLIFQRLLLAIFGILVCGCHRPPINLEPAIVNPPAILICNMKLQWPAGMLFTHSWISWTVDGSYFQQIEVLNDAYSEHHGYVVYDDYVSTLDAHLRRPYNEGTLVTAIYGEDAKKIIIWILNNWQKYPYIHEYSYIGPNSNTFIQWLIDNASKETGIKVRDLAPSSFGRFYLRKGHVEN